MNEDIKSLIVLGVILLAEQYMVAPWQFTAFARMWDWLANFFAALASAFGWAAMHARANYYTAVNTNGA